MKRLQERLNMHLMPKLTDVETELEFEPILSALCCCPGGSPAGAGRRRAGAAAAADAGMGPGSHCQYSTENVRPSLARA